MRHFHILWRYFLPHGLAELNKQKAENKNAARSRDPPVGQWHALEQAGQSGVDA